ncbi:MAG: DUF4390 domain-containing protein [Syntrophales bacterium]|nr:DUF4390 domain-containing protein [Syntrophales bacterium]
MKRISGLSICLIFSFFLFSPLSIRAENAGIKDILVTNNSTHLLVYARVTNCFTKDMDAAILAGIPTTFTFLVELYQVRSRWLDKNLIRLTIRHTIKYDNVKRLFYVTYDEDKEPASFQDYESAKQAMADLNGVPVALLKALKRGEYYYVQIKAKLDKVRLPLHMEYIFFFVSLWDFETDWHQEGFYY